MKINFIWSKLITMTIYANVLFFISYKKIYLYFLIFKLIYTYSKLTYAANNFCKKLFTK